MIALGTPRELIATLGGEHMIELTLDECNGQPRLDPAALADLPAVISARAEDGQVCLAVTEPHLVLPALLDRLKQMKCELTSLNTRHASLEDVFVKLAGRHLADE